VLPRVGATNDGYVVIGSTDREEIRAALGPRAGSGVRSSRDEFDEI
jgi:hypothetical protein